jgi:hypothetical protein
MTVKAPHALEQDVHWAKVRDEQIGIYIETLLESLCPYDDPPAYLVATLAHLLLDGGVEFRPILAAKPTVVQGADPRKMK